MLLRFNFIKFLLFLLWAILPLSRKPLLLLKVVSSVSLNENFVKFLQLFCVFLLSYAVLVKKCSFFSNHLNIDINNIFLCECNTIVWIRLRFFKFRQLTKFWKPVNLVSIIEVVKSARVVVNTLGRLPLVHKKLRRKHGTRLL